MAPSVAAATTTVVCSDAFPPLTGRPYTMSESVPASARAGSEVSPMVGTSAGPVTRTPASSRPGPVPRPTYPGWRLSHPGRRPGAGLPGSSAPARCPDPDRGPRRDRRRRPRPVTAGPPTPESPAGPAPPADRTPDPSSASRRDSGGETTRGQGTQAAQVPYRTTSWDSTRKPRGASNSMSGGHPSTS